MVFGSVAPWPLSADLATGRLGAPGTPSNITNAVGYLGGVTSRRIPFEDYRLLAATLPRYCELHYDETRSEISGTVTDSCGSAIPSAAIRLEELGDAPVRRLRSTTARGGAYRIMALEAPLPYEIQIAMPGFRTHTDTIHVSPGQQLIYDAVLTGFSCGS